jgi:putative hemolysin
MSAVDNQEERVYSGYNFSYSSPEDSWFKRLIITTIENRTGKPELQRIYNELHDNNPDPYKVWKEILDKLNITMDFDAEQLKKIPKTGPVIFVANHPYGIVDGAIFLHLVSRIRKDYFLLINEVLAKEPILKGHLLPVDFRGNKAALECNLNSKEETTRRLNNGEALIIFPSGAVSTRPRWSLNGKAEEWPWRRFICTRIHETKCTVVPFYFHGENSNWFHWVSKFSMNLRLGLLLHEVMNKRGKTIRTEIGDPITYSEMEQFPDRQELIEYLQKRTLDLVK